MSDETSKPMLRLAGVIGDPIAHSKSPLIHNFWIKRLGAPGLYAPVPVRAEDLRSWADAAPRFGFVGFNVTLPHKQVMLELVAEATPRAVAAGSVNTVWVDDGRLYGDSTDGEGFCASLRAAGAPSFAGQTVAFLGAGGAARAVLAALAGEGVARIRLSNRSADRAAELADTVRAGFSVEIERHDWPPAPGFFEGADLIVNGTTLGMVGQAPFDLTLPSLSSSVVATDLIYAPLETPFLNAAAAAGATTVDGLGMLLHQAAPGFERWFGSRPEVTSELRRVVLEQSGYLP